MAFFGGRVPFTENKFWELEGLRDKNFINWVNVAFRVNRKVDHAGLELAMELVGFSLAFRIYDSRHWDWDKNEWSNGI